MEIRSLLLLCMLLVCAGCRYSGKDATHAAPLLSAAGQWSFSTGPRGPDIMAGLVHTAKGVSGKATVYGCGEKTEQTEITGLVGQQGRMALHTAMMQNGVVLALEGDLSADGMTFVGFLRSSLFAHCAIGREGPVRGSREPLAYGEYAGDVLSTTGDAKLQATISVQQHTPFGPGGRYPVSTSIFLPDSRCAGNVPLQAEQGKMSGNVLTAVYVGSKGQDRTQIALKAVLVGAGSFLQVLDIAVTGGPCSKFHGTGRLTLD